MTAMKYSTFIIISILTLGMCSHAQAGQAEARDIAISNNCPPKKIEVYQQALGENGATIYRIQCTLPKTVASADNSAKPPDTLLITCTQNLCDLLKMETLDDKK